MHELSDLQREELEHLANEIRNIGSRLAGFISEADREMYERARAQHLYRAEKIRTGNVSDDAIARRRAQRRSRSDMTWPELRADIQAEGDADY